MTIPFEHPLGLDHVDYVRINDGSGHYLLLPSLTTSQRDSLSPEDGMFIFNSTANEVQCYSGSSWAAWTSGPKGDTGVGVQGDTGADSTVQGDTGVGVQGDTGADSTVQGDTGVGVQGDTGVGIQGDTGADSTVPGPQGDTGVGVQGDTGAGVQGDTGATGPEPARIIVIKVIPDDSPLETGDGQAYFTIPSDLNGLNLTDADAAVYTASSSGTPTVQIHNVTSAVDVLSTEITIDVSEYSSYTAATAPAINGSSSSVATGDRFRFDVDVAGTDTTGLDVIMVFG